MVQAARKHLLKYKHYHCLSDDDWCSKATVLDMVVKDETPFRYGPGQDSNSGSSDLWSNALPTRPQRLGGRIVPSRRSSVNVYLAVLRLILHTQMGWETLKSNNLGKLRDETSFRHSCAGVQTPGWLMFERSIFDQFSYRLCYENAN